MVNFDLVFLEVALLIFFSSNKNQGQPNSQNKWMSFFLSVINEGLLCQILLISIFLRLQTQQSILSVNSVSFDGGQWSWQLPLHQESFAVSRHCFSISLAGGRGRFRSGSISKKMHLCRNDCSSLKSRVKLFICSPELHHLLGQCLPVGCCPIRTGNVTGKMHRLPPHQLPFQNILVNLIVIPQFIALLSWHGRGWLARLHTSKCPILKWPWLCVRPFQFHLLSLQSVYECLYFDLLSFRRGEI